MATADRLIEFFNEAKALPPGAQRERFLATANGVDAKLRTEVDELLRAHEKTVDFLKPGAGVSPGLEAESARLKPEEPGERIGHYKLLEQTGQGGFGNVWVAEQERPVRRRVALKIIKLGMDTREVIARFEQERQALAMMDHPNIAKVFDAGATETGRPYFVMELVRGIKITEHCDQANLSTADRLELFIAVCQAVQHAHQKGIIHRDLKPSNILVTLHDGVPVPKVIDFGIAKATEQRLTDQTIFTCFEQFIGTPAYMSPEQAGMTSVDIDTRTDIYSLGVLLYELLTGRTPFDAEKLVASGLDEIRRIIREKEPPKLSTRLRTLDPAELETVAARRQTESPALIRLLRGDLEWIVMKCLEKDRARRYATANGLATDLQRYLNDEPVAARAPSRSYRFRKMVRRNKVAFAAATAVAAALVLLTFGSTIAAWRVGLARRAEHTERQKADAANRDLRDANNRLAETVNALELRRAEDSFRAHDPVAGVAQLAAMLRRDPADHIAASRLVSALVHRNWALPASAPMRHRDRVQAVSFSPDGRHVLSASWDRTAKIWDAATGKTVATLQHDDRVFSARYSSDGARILTASADGTVRIWNAANGVLLTSLDHQRRKVHWAEFSPDGESVVTACAGDQNARTWNAVTGALTKELPSDASEVLIARFNPEGERVATASRDGSIRIWDVRLEKTIVEFQAHRETIHALAFSPDGQRLASAGDDGTARLWNANTGQPFGAPLRHDSAVTHAVFSSDGQVLLTTSTDTGARLWEATNLQLIRQPLRHEGGVTFGAFSPDARTVVTTSMDNSARLWEVGTGKPLCQPLRERETILHASFSPDGGQLATGSWDNTVQVWKIQPRRFAGIAIRHEKRAATVAFGPRGESVLSASFDETARLWNARTGQALGEPMRHQGAVHCADFSADGARIVTASADGTANVWDASTGQIIAGPLQHAQAILSAQFSPDAARVVTASKDGTARVWDALTGKPATPPLAHGAVVKVARFSPDGQWVVSASDNRSARVWNAQTGQPMTDRLEHLDHVEWAEFSPDSQRVVSASSDNTARMWDVHTGRPIGAPLQHPRTVQKAVFSPDGRRVATASLDQTARIWDATTGEAMTQPLEHHGAVSQVCFSPDGRRILTATWSGAARLWDATNGRPLTEWLEANGAVFSACFDSTGERIATGGEGGVRVWEVPPVRTPVPQWFFAFAESVAGTRWSARGNTEFVPRRELEELARQLVLDDGDDLYHRVAQWFLADPEQRAASPF